MTAVVILPVSLPLPLFLMASVFTAIALYLVASEGPRRRLVVALLVACVLSAPAVLHAEDVVISGDVCKAMPWLIECWCPICF